MTTLSSYPSIFAAGHRLLADIFAEPVLVEEKIDGSQFSFGIDELGVLRCRSKGAEVYDSETDVTQHKMFDSAVATVKDLRSSLMPGWIYRGEYLSRPNHNTTSYNRVPTRHIILFDIERGVQDFMSWENKAQVANALGLDVVPCLYHGMITSAEQLKSLIPNESILGGTKVEGVVAKNYSRFGQDKKILIAKVVRDGYKEENRLSWKVRNPSQNDIVQRIVETYQVEPRRRKAVQHLRDAGKLQGAPQDIPELMRELVADLEKECKEDILTALWNYHWPQIRRGVTKGAAEWYKQQLLEDAFAPSTEKP